MGQVRHGSAVTTHAVWAALQRSQALLSELKPLAGGVPHVVSNASAISARAPWARNVSRRW